MVSFLKVRYEGASKEHLVCRTQTVCTAQYGNVWRTDGDITASWPEIMRVLDNSVGLMRYSKPSGWADLDMLEVEFCTFFRCCLSPFSADNLRLTPPQWRAPTLLDTAPG